jgi:hypothetical protein
MLPELIDRVASMLNYFLTQLAGPNAKELSVDNRKKYNFDPRLLLELILGVITHLSVCEPFALGNDGSHLAFMLCPLALFKFLLQRLRVMGAATATKCTRRRPRLVTSAAC